VESPTLISQGVRIEGTVQGRGDVRIDGALQGTLAVDGAVHVHRGATVEASLKADEVVIHGAVRGPVAARRAITLADGASADGDLEAPLLGVAPTARVRGRLSMQIDTPRGARSGRHRG